MVIVVRRVIAPGKVAESDMARVLLNLEIPLGGDPNVVCELPQVVRQQIYIRGG